MAGYSGTPLWKKLGYKTGITAYVEGSPDRYLESLALPAEIAVRWLARPEASIQFVHLFVTEAAVLRTRLKSWRGNIAPDGVIWISWPKKSSGVPTSVNEHLVRELALPMGLVDIKVCAVDEVWSGLKLVIRKELR